MECELSSLVGIRLIPREFMVNDAEIIPLEQENVYEYGLCKIVAVLHSVSPATGVKLPSDCKVISCAYSSSIVTPGGI
jgi:hypothetical protein